MKKRDFGGSLLMGVLRDIHSNVFMAKMNYSNTETLSMILEGLQTLYRKSGRCVWGDALKVSKTGLTFLRTIVVIAGTDGTLLPLNGHWLIIFCLTNFRARSIMFHPRTRSSKSLETFLQGKMCREGVKPRLHRRISSHWQDFHFE